MTGTAPRTQPLLPEDPHRLGPFALTARLGSGGMGVVYLGRHDDGRAAAVKVVHPHLIGDPDFRSRFDREIALAHRVDGPWTARVIDADPFASRPWLATEYVEGSALDEQVGRTGPLPAPELDLLARRLAEALAELHATAVVHRDLKPSNVLLASDGPRLIDFGIARSIDATKITHTGHVVGTPAYMAPEQAAGEEAGPASDVFSLASVLVFAATGRGPFGTAAHPAAMLLRVMQQEPDLAAVPAPLRERLVPCFAREPADRPTAAQLAAAWNPDGERAPTAASPPGSAGGTSGPAPTRVSTSLGPPPLPERAPRLLVVANAVLAVLVVATFAVAFFWVPTSAAPPAAAVAAAIDGAIPQATDVAEVAEIPLDAPAAGIAVSEDGRTVMVATAAGVRFVDTATRSVSPTTPLPARTTTLSLTPDGSRAYVMGRGISMLDVRSGVVTGLVGEIPDSFGSSTIDADGRTAYVAYSLRADIGIIDLTDGREIGSIPIGTTDGSLTQTRDGYLFVTGGIDPADAGRADRGLVVHTPTRRVIGTLPERALDVAVDAAGDRAFVLLGGGDVAVVDAGSGTPIGPTVRAFPEGTSSLAVTPGGEVMLGSSSLREPSVVHISDASGMPRQDLDTGADIRGLTLSPDGRTLYVAVRGPRNAVLVYDTSVLVR